MPQPGFEPGTSSIELNQLSYGTTPFRQLIGMRLYEIHVFLTYFFSYQNGPDTYLLQVKGPDFPARLREYLSVARMASHEFREVRCPIIKERRRFIDVVDEERERRRESRLDAWAREDYTTYKPAKILGETHVDEVTEVSN